MGEVVAAILALAPVALILLKLYRDRTKRTKEQKVIDAINSEIKKRQKSKSKGTLELSHIDSSRLDRVRVLLSKARRSSKRQKTE